MTLAPWFLLLLAVPVLLLGQWLLRRVPLLARYCIPVPVAGGLLFALACLLLRGAGLEFSFATKVSAGAWTWLVTPDHAWLARPAKALNLPLLVGFFTCVGLAAPLRLLAGGGRMLLVLLLGTTVLAVLQNAVGVALASALGVPALLGVLCGSLTLVGGHGTALGFAPRFEQAGMAAAATIGASAATFGLLAGALLSGPLGAWLLRPRAPAQAASADPASPVHIAAGINHTAASNDAARPGDAPRSGNAAGAGSTTETVSAAGTGDTARCSVAAGTGRTAASEGAAWCGGTAGSGGAAGNGGAVGSGGATRRGEAAGTGCAVGSDGATGRGEAAVYGRAVEAGGGGVGRAVVADFVADVRALARDGRVAAGHLLLVAACIKGGAWISFGFDLLGATLPAYMGALLLGFAVRAMHDAAGATWLRGAIVNRIAAVLLPLFLVITLAPLNLAELASVAGPMLLILAVNSALTLAFAAWIIFPLLGRDREAAVATVGLAGFGIGSTATAVAAMDATTRQHGPAPRATTLVPPCGGFLIDLTNAPVLGFYLYWLSATP